MFRSSPRSLVGLQRGAVETIMIGSIRQRRVAATFLFSSLALASGNARQQPAMERIPQFENDRAVSWKSVIPPHTESTMHRHDRYRSIVAIVGGDLKTVSPTGETTVTH